MEEGGPSDRCCRTVDIVIPVLNEAHVLADSVATVRAFAAEALIEYHWTITIVDNGSTDGTDVVGAKLAARFPDVGFTSLTELGRGRALRHVWTHSTADIVCYTDVDLSTELAALPKLLRVIANGECDVATGSRLLPTSQTTRSRKRELVSRCYNALIKLLFWNTFSDAQCGFKAVSRRVVTEIVPRVKNQSWFFDTELLLLAEKAGYRIADIPVRWIEDDDSRVKIAATAWEDIKGLVRVRWTLWHQWVHGRPRTAGSKRPAY